MIAGKSVLGIIAARGGSKGLPRKNILPAGGKPLIAWTIEAARGSRCLDRIILSSEDPEIIDVAKSFGCDVPFVRPLELAQDETLIVDVLQHAIDAVGGADYLVLLQPTSPLRTSADIDAGIALCEASGAPVCISMTETAKSPYWMYFLDADKHLRPVMPETGFGVATRRQELKKTYAPNGAVYVARTDWFLRHKTFLSPETVAYEMPSERSVDIDSAQDLFLFEALLKAGC